MQVGTQSQHRILCVGNEWFAKRPSGLNRYIYELTATLAEQGDAIEFCGLAMPQEQPVFGPILTDLAQPEDSLLRRFWTTRGNFRQRTLQRPDAINLHFALSAWPILSELPADIPVTFTFHGPWCMESAAEGQARFGIWLKRRMEQQVYNRCDRFIVLSKAFGSILHDLYGIPWDKIFVVPGGVNLARFRPTVSRQEARAQLGWPLEKTILFTPRRLVRRMGIDQLLIALQSVQSEVLDVWLAIAGKGPMRETFEEQAQALGLSHTVNFLGYLPDEQLPLAYQAADLTVVPSQTLEGFGLILLESLACGTPVLSTPVGGMPEVLSPFSPQLLSKSATASAIAQQLSLLLSGTLSLPTREECRDYAARKFDWQKVAQDVKQILLQPK
ncbi:MAG TPA: glycosyltransferase family 4 protein [Stenomitos sp.]